MIGTYNHTYKKHGKIVHAKRHHSFDVGFVTEKNIDSIKVLIDNYIAVMNTKEKPPEKKYPTERFLLAAYKNDHRAGRITYKNNYSYV